MLTSSVPKAREVWWASAGTKVRLCIVLVADVAADSFEVIYGQSADDHSAVHVAVRLGSFEGKRLRVNQDTFFRETNVEDIALAAFKSFVALCPAGVFGKVEQMIATAAAGRSAAADAPSDGQPPSDPTTKE